MAKSKKTVEYEQALGELTADLQRTRADFENYRKRMEAEKTAAMHRGESRMVVKLLPLIDTIRRATGHLPEELADNAWAKGIVALDKNLQKLMSEFTLEQIVIEPGVTPFDPTFHEAISADGEGEIEVVSEELQGGYLLDNRVVRHSLVRVQRHE